MFTGIIEHKSSILEARQNKKMLELSIARPKGWKLKLGESIAVNGACLTIAQMNTKEIQFDIMPETLSKTTFGKINFEEANLERPLLAGARFHGHFVEGHVDCVGTVEKISDDKNGKQITISFPKEFSKYIVPRGSIAVNGVSLTIAKCSKNAFTIALIPHTILVTTLGSLKKGNMVNLEFDILSKQIIHILQNHHVSRNR